MANDYKIKISTPGAKQSQKQIQGLTGSFAKLGAKVLGVVAVFKTISLGFKAVNASMKKTIDVVKQSVNIFGDLETGIAEIRTLTGGLGESVDEYGTRWSPVVRDKDTDW